MVPSGSGMGSQSRQGAPEDIELPMLELTTALSDGYASPRALPSLGPSRTHSDDEEVGEGVPIVARGDPSSHELDLEARLSGARAQKRARERCWGCTAGRVATVLVGNLHRLIILGVIVALLVLVSLKGVRIFGEILRWFERQNSWWPGWVSFLLLFITAVTLFLPGVALILGAGFVFGFWKGLLAVWVGGAIGQGCSFLLARYLVRDWVVTYIARKWSKWELVDDMIEAEGWILVVLLRLSPIVPWNLLNIVMATTRIHFVSFFLASAIGIGFESSVLAYFGSLAQDIHHIVGGDANPHGPIVYVLTGTSLAFCAVAAIVATLYTKRALKRAAEQRRLAEEDGPLSYSADPGDPEGGFGTGLEAGYDPLGSPLPGRDRKAPVIGSLIGSLRVKRAMEPEWSVAAADEEGGTPRRSPSIMAEAGVSRVRHGKSDGVPVHAFSHAQSILQDGIEMQSPRRSEDGSAADGGHRKRDMPSAGVACP